MTRGPAGRFWRWAFRGSLVLPPILMLGLCGWANGLGQGPEAARVGMQIVVVGVFPLLLYWILAVPILGLLAWRTRGRPPA